MIEEILTILGIIFLGINFGLINTYMQTSTQASGASSEFTNLGIPTSINTFLVFFLLWGIIQSKKSEVTKLLVITLLVLFTAAELYFIYNKPEKNELRWFYTFIIYISFLIKLYLLITLHSDVSSETSKNIFSNIRMPKISLPERKQSTDKLRVDQTRIGQPNPRPEPELFVDKQKSQKIFDSVLAKTDLSDEERQDFEDRFLLAFEEEQPWQKANSALDAILNKIPEEKMTREDKQELRGRFISAMGRPPRTGGRR